MLAVGAERHAGHRPGGTPVREDLPAVRCVPHLHGPIESAEAIRLPSGLNATLKISPVCPLSVRISRPLGMSHSFTVRSELAARCLPSGLNATLLTPEACPLSVRVSFPVAASQTLTTPSTLLPETRRRPSGLNATLLSTRVGCLLEGEDSLPGRGVPHPHGLIPTGGGDPPAVGAERHAVDQAAVPFERKDFLPGRRVPDFHRRSRPAEAIRWPSGLYATAMTRPVCPLRVICPEAIFRRQ